MVRVWLIYIPYLMADHPSFRRNPLEAIPPSPLVAVPVNTRRRHIMSQGQKDKKWDIRSLSFAPLRTEGRKQHKRPGQKCSSAGCHLLQGQVIHVELMALTGYWSWTQITSNETNTGLPALIYWFRSIINLKSNWEIPFRLGQRLPTKINRHPPLHNRGFLLL